MKRNFIFLILMCLLGGLIPMNVMAQETVVISGDPEKYSSSTTDYAPIRTYNSRSYSQFLYLKEELNMDEGASITGISFKVNKSDNAFPFSRTKIKVYLSSTELTNFTSTTMIKPSANDLLFEGTMTFSGIGWLTITLDNPYTYDGKNILVSVWDNQGSYIEYTYFDSFTPIDANSEERRCAYKTGNSANPVTATIYGSLHAHTPQIQFTFTPAGPSVPTPPTVTLNTPENNATGIFNPSLNFTLGNAGSYELKFGTTNPPTETVLSQSENIPSNVSYQTNLLNPNTPYYWQVSATNDDGTTTSEVFSFTTKEFAVPGAITNVSPENNAQGLINPVLSWTFGENTEQQQLLIDGVVKVDWTNIGSKTNDSYQTSGLTAGEHTWQVNVRNGADNGETEDVDEGVTVGIVYTFTVANLPDNVTAVSPANGATNVSSKTIKWQFAENTTQYRFLYGESEASLAYCGYGTAETWLDVTTNEVEVEAPYFVTGTTYYWAVDVKNSVGQRTVYQGGDPITVYSFTTASTLAVSNTAPANGATNLENPALRWNYVGNAQQYRVYLGTDENNLPAVTEWTTREGTSGSYQTTDLNGSTEHFWRVDIKDEDGSVIAGEVWSFVTTLPAPTNVAANPVQIVPTLSMTYGSTTISWDDMGATGYNVYLGTSRLNKEGLITETSYEIAANAMKLSYNMNPGYDIFVQAVYEIGESDMSEAVNVKVTGFGYFKATIYKNDWSNRLEGATVTLTCTEDEFGNVYNGDGIEYSFTTNSLGEAFETITVKMPDGSEITTTNTSLRVFNGTYAVVVEKENYSTFNGSVEITNGQTSELYEPNEQYPGVRLTPDNSVLFNVILSDVSFESINVNLDGGASAGQYHVYLSNGTETTDLGMRDFAGGSGNIYFTYSDWGTLGKGNYLFGVAKVESQINWSDVAFRNYDVFETTGSWSEEANWRDKEFPGTNAEVYVLAAATIDDKVEVTVNNIIIKETGSLTINGSLTANNVTNLNVGKLIINDGAQLRQNNSELRAKFVMKIKTPTNWSAIGNTDGWQFIASPFTNAAISSFTNVTGGYDLFKFDGTKEKEEWVNQNKENEEEEDNGDDNIVHGAKEGEPEPFETSFVNGRGYLASYEKATEATLSGTVNSANEYSFTVGYKADGKWENFYLLGNPFTFVMDWNNVQTSNLADGFVTIDPVNGYVYHENGGTIAVGDGFFVKAIAETPTIAYNESIQSKRGGSESINLIATGKAGSDNVIINLNEEKEGFNKLDNFNKNIASIFVSKENKRYGIASYDKDVTEIPVSFDAKQMGNYTIAAKANGKFETLILVDRFTGIETNLLVEDYHFTATSSDNHDRFIVKLVNGQQSTDNSHFAYVSGEDLIIEAEGSVEIIDMMGRVVYTSEIESANNRINVSAFNNAAYLIRVVNEEGVKTQKLIVNSL